jgi:hypothetical protein
MKKPIAQKHRAGLAALEAFHDDEVHKLQFQHRLLKEVIRKLDIIITLLETVSNHPKR